MAFPTSPTNGQTTTVNGITYAYNSTNNAWKRQTLTDITVSGNLIASSGITTNGNIIVGGNVSVGGSLNWTANGQPFLAEIYESDPISTDGINREFQLSRNSQALTLTNPFQVMVMLDGSVQPAFLANYDTVWLSHCLSSQMGYTVINGNVVFSDSPYIGSTITARTLVGTPTQTPSIYPFKPLDVMLGA